LTRIELAQRTGRTYRALTKLESGQSEPNPETVAALSEALAFPEDFFYATAPELLLAPNASFRAFTRMTQRQRDAALGAGSLALELSRWVEDRFELPDPDVPDVPISDFKPEAAAAAVRAAWGLGERPIRNMVHLLESKGVRVFSLREKCVEIDAFSVWRDNRPFVFLNSMKTAEHGRFDAAHELGHLVMHRRDQPQGRQYESEADQFASAFLMPASDVKAAGAGISTLGGLVTLKARWLVSVSALAYRMHALELLTKWHYHSICVQISKLGFRKREPNPISRETSLVLQKVFSALRAEGVSRPQIARDLRLHPDDVSALVFGLVVTGLDGGKMEPPSTPPRADLRLVRR
jgi:Zn-dependent peptidase ImmA (M78 family)